MAQSKTDLFEEKYVKSAEFFKALAHPARLQILQLLSEANTCITGDISDHLPLGRTTVNQHIKELKKIGLIQGEIQGVKTKYCLNASVVEELKHVLQSLLNSIKTDDLACE